MAVAVAIGLAGVAASFAALAAARRREFGMLRHLGLTRRQIGWMLAQEGALAAGVGVFAGLLVGGAIGLVLILRNLFDNAVCHADGGGVIRVGGSSGDDAADGVSSAKATVSVGPRLRSLF